MAKSLSNASVTAYLYDQHNTTCAVADQNLTGESLGIKVRPSEVRLKVVDGETRYTWQIDDPSIKHLFKKHMSKHSVGAYMQLYQEVGKSFQAIRAQRPRTETPEPSSSKELQDLQEENAMLIDKLEQAKKHSAEQADEIQLLKSIIREAQVTIDLHQQDLQQWISVAKYYQQSCFQCSDVLGQAITFLQGLKSEIPASTPVQD